MEYFMRINNNVLNEGVFYEVKEYLYPIVKRKALILISVALLVAGALLFRPKILVGVICIVFGALVLLETLTIRNKAARQAVAQIQGAIGKDHCTYTYTFEPDKLNVYCIETKVSENIPYDYFARTRETEHTFLLFTKESRMVIIRKNVLDENKLADLKAYLAEKCENLTTEEK